MNSRAPLDFHTCREKIRGNRGREIYAPAIARMREPELPCVEHLAGKVAALSIHLVTENRVGDVLEVNANLVSAPAVERALHEGPSFELGKHAPVRASFAPTRTQHRHLLPVHRV